MRNAEHNKQRLSTILALAAFATVLAGPAHAAQRAGRVAGGTSKPAQQSPPTSTKMVAFGDEPSDSTGKATDGDGTGGPADDADANPPGAAPSSTVVPTPTKPAASLDPRRSSEAARATSSLRAQIIPAPPRVVVHASRALAGGRTPEFTARSAAASTLSINSPFGVRHDPLTGAARMHTGVDLHATFGQSVGTSMSGVVLYAGEKGGYGNCVIVDHGSGISTYYAHLSAIAVVAGQSVDAGQVVGYVGSTGRSTGPHLHYEVRANGHPLDPVTQISLDAGQLYVAGRAVDGAAGDALNEKALPLAPDGSTMMSADLDGSTLSAWKKDDIDVE